VEKLNALKPLWREKRRNLGAFGVGPPVCVGAHFAMASTCVKDPRKMATPGDVVRVKVLEVDPKRRRI
jgi:uncharacterized protein